MTTERLRILAGAVALREFTASQLAAFTGANANTVRQVLRRELQSRQLFLREQPRWRGAATVWRLDDAHLGEVLEELASEESRIHELQILTSAQQSRSKAVSLDPVRRVHFYLASAEDAVRRSYGAPDGDERLKLAQIALTLANAANPGEHEAAEGTANWWASTRDEERRAPLTVTSLENVSGVGIGGDATAASSRAVPLSEIDLARRKASLIVAFANLSAQQAVGHDIGPEDLGRVAEIIGESKDVIPLQDTLNWVKIFIDASSESGNLPPVAVVTKSTKAPSELFLGEVQNWQRVQAPELAPTGYTVWIEQWAEALLDSNLIPGVVVSHDDSPESDQVLEAVMARDRPSRIPRPVIVASITNNVEDVSLKVAEEGGVFLAIRKSVGLLAPTVRRVVERAAAVNIDDTWVDSISSKNTRNELTELYNAAYARDICETLNSFKFRLSDLERAQHLLAALSQIFSAHAHGATAHALDSQTLPEATKPLIAAIDDPQEAITALEQAVDANRLLIGLQDKQSYRAFLSAMLREPNAVAQRADSQEAMRWAYERLLQAEH